MSEMVKDQMDKLEEDEVSSRQEADWRHRKRAERGTLHFLRLQQLVFYIVTRSRTHYKTAVRQRPVAEGRSGVRTQVSLGNEGLPVVGTTRTQICHSLKFAHAN